MLPGSSRDDRAPRRRGECAPIFLPAQLLQPVKDGTENIRVVIGNDLAEIFETICALDDARDALEAHAGVNVLCGQWGKRAVGIRVELNENQIPNFNTSRVAFVDQRTFSVTIWSQINVNFRARSARTGLSHHPKIILLAAIDDVNFRVQSRRGKLRRPKIVCLLIKLARIALFFVRTVNRRVKTIFWKLPNFRDQFPRPINRLFFEIIAEAPIPEHLEERVMVRIEPDIFEVVVLAAGANALLRVRRAGGFSRNRSGPFVHVWSAFVQKNRHELVHARVGEEQAGRIRHQTG